MLLAALLFALVQDPVAAAPPAAAGGDAETIVTAPRSRLTATSSRAHVTVVTAEELRATGARSLPLAISRAAGVWVQETNLGGGSPFIRGLVGNQVLIVVDGVRLNDSTTRSGPNQSLNTIDPAIVERVEVIRGPSSVLYGSDAIGGAILIWTKTRLPASRGGEAGLDGGLDVLYRSVVDGAYGTVDGSWADEDDGVLVIGSLFDWDDLETADGEVPFTGYGGEALFGSWTHAFDESRALRITARYHEDDDVPRTDRLIAGFGQTNPSSSIFEFNVQRREGYLISYTDDEPSELGDRFQARLSYRRYREDREEMNFGSSTFSYERDEVDTVGLGLDWTKALGDDHLLTYGFDVEHDEVDSFDRETNEGATAVGDGDFAPGASYTSFGAFAQDEIFAFDPFDVTLGVRFSHFAFSYDAFSDPSDGTAEDGEFSALTASLQVARNVSDDVRLTGTLAQGYRAPNLDELAKNGSFFGGTELANPDLDPERSLTAELAVDVVKERWWGALAVFGTRIEDLVGRRLDQSGTPGNEIFVRDNVGEADIYGVEARARVQLCADSPYFGEASAGWTRGRQYDDTVDPATGEAPFDGVEFRRIPPLHGRAALRYEPQESNHGIDWAELELFWADDQEQLHPEDVTDSRIDPDGTPGFGIVNLSAGGPLGDGSALHWRAGVENVLDKDYRIHGSGFDGPGRGIFFGLSYRP